MFQNPDSLDPGQTGLITVAQVLSTIFDTLIWKFPNDPKYYPGLAESYTVSPDARTYTFKLRKGVKFHDGTPFDANAVKATFDHIVDPKTKSLSAVGALGPYQETKVSTRTPRRCVHRGQRRVRERDVPADHGHLLAGRAEEVRLRLQPAPGRHRAVRVQAVHQQRPRGRDQEPGLQLGARPAGQRPAKLSQITFRILPDPSSQANALTTGEIQIAQNLNPGDVQSAVSAGKKKLTALSTGMPYCILANNAKPPTDELAVRQAIEFSVNTKAIIDTLFKGLYTPATSVLTPTTPGYNSDQVLYQFDPARAAHLLDGAGWTNRAAPGPARASGWSCSSSTSRTSASTASPS